MSTSNEDHVSFCADLVTSKQLEAFPTTLFKAHRPGDWTSVTTLCQEIGIATTGIKSELVTTWLLDPFGDQAYAVIIFYDDETKESFAAHYNKSRLLDHKG